MVVGVLALQGAVEPHAEKLRELGAEVVRVRRPDQFDGLDGLIIPGGESTTFLHLLKLKKMWEPLQAFLRGKPVWGVCAGTILLARKVTGPDQDSLGAIGVDVERNGFGRQVDSFISAVDPTEEWDGSPVEGVFIRAPRITGIHGKVRVLLTWHGEPVMVEDGHVLASTFHPELTENTAVHRYFLKKCGD